MSFFFRLLPFLFDLILIPFILVLSYSLKFKLSLISPLFPIYPHAQFENYYPFIFYICFVWTLCFYLLGVYKIILMF